MKTVPEEYLDFEHEGYLRIDRTAGLDIVYFEENSIKTREEVLKFIYK